MINKILGMDSGTRTRATLSIVTAVVDILSVFNVISFSDEQVDAIKNIVLVAVSAVVWLIGFYYNESYSEISCEYTGEMRAKKAEHEDGYMITEGDEIDESEVSEEL